MQSSQQPGKQVNVKTVTGFILDLPSKEEESDGEYDDDDSYSDDNWLDYSQMKSAFMQGTFVTNTKRPRYGRVQIQDSSNHKHICYGRFVLKDPWWNVTVDIGARNRVCRGPEYVLRTDQDGITKHNLVPLLVNKAFRKLHVDTDISDVVTEFEQFCRKEVSGLLTFELLENLLYKFAHVTPNYKLETYNILRQDMMQTVLRAYIYPVLLKFLCTLFPQRFLSYFLAAKPSILPRLQAAAVDEPWVFGFAVIMAARFSVFGPEANYKVFKEADIMHNIPPVQKDALYIYEVLKTDASRNGHTYISFLDLRQHHYWAQLNHDVSDWLAALSYLSENKVTVEERFDSRRNIFLYHNWRAEVDITAGLGTVLDRGIQAGTPAWDVDFSSCELDGLRSDTDQWLAAQKMVASPVCILSGKGGCGKTTVVTKLVQHVCLQNSVTLESETELKDDDLDFLPNADLVQCSGDSKQVDISAGDTVPHHQTADANSSCSIGTIGLKQTENAISSQSQPLQCSAVQLSQMIDSLTQSLEEQRLSKGQSKEDQIRIDLTTDLLKYIGTSGHVSLSKTAAGRKILLTAPTGKAAKLLGLKAKMESYTLHRIIFSYRAFLQAQKMENDDSAANGRTEEVSSKDSGEKLTKRKGPLGSENGGCSADLTTDGVWKHAATETLIVDECSLVSLRLFATLLQILLINTPLKKIILLGDVRQLPSIEPGNFLSDIFSTFQERGLSVELRTNHRSESELIVSNASRISQRQIPQIDPGRNFHFCCLQDSSSEQERDETIRKLLNNQQELHTHDSSQFVAFRRVDCDAINELCCQHYNSHNMRKPSSRSSKQVCDFRVGDKICCSKNGQVLNFDERLHRYLEPYPDILEAICVATKRQQSKPLDTSQGNVLTPVQMAGNSGRNFAGNTFSSVVATFKVSASKNVEDKKCASEVAEMISVKQENLWEGECVDVYNCKMSLLTDSDARLKQDQMLISQYHNKPSQEETCLKQENWRNDYQPEHNYIVQTTESGIHMEYLAQNPSVSDHVPISACVDRTRHQKLRLEDIGTVKEAEAVPGTQYKDAAHSDRMVNSEQNEDEEQARKLKAGIVQLCNGEVFFIMDDVTEMESESGKEQRYLTLSDRDPQCPRVICTTYLGLKRICQIRHAWARTIHTYQGSESDTVVYYVGHSRLQNWKHVYTAVTRGRKAVFIVGKERELRQAVWEKDRPRRSRLARRLKDMMKDMEFGKLQSMLYDINQLASHSWPRATHPFIADTTSASPSDHPVKRSLIDSFPDSDDSWIKNMSPVWVGDSDTFEEDVTTSGDYDGFVELNVKGETASLSVMGDEVQHEEVLSTPKRYLSVECSPITPKRIRSSDPVDDIVSPVRRNLNI